jgi:hypothetical protein
MVKAKKSSKTTVAASAANSSGTNLNVWCWYCDRHFLDEKILITHQRCRHFKCPVCPRKLNSPSGLLVHAAQVHKLTLDKVPNAMEERDSAEVEVFGMRGISAEDVKRKCDGLPIVQKRKTNQMSDIGLVSIMAAEKKSNASSNFFYSVKSNTENGSNNSLLISDAKPNLTELDATVSNDISANWTQQDLHTPDYLSPIIISPPPQKIITGNINRTVKKNLFDD